METIRYLGEAFLIAYVMRMVSSKLRIPAVSGYVVGGVLIGGSLFFWIPSIREVGGKWFFGEDAFQQLNFITHIALGTIALTIGAELEWKRINLLGKSIFCIALTEALLAFAVVFLVIFIFWHDVALGLVLGAVSSATAPAATVAVIQQYRAKGPLTNTILAVVGIDDAISFIIFAFALTMTKSILMGKNIELVTGLLMPLVEICLSLVVGLVIGYIGARLLALSRDSETVIFVIAMTILWITAVSEMFDLSELLANMSGGVIIINMYPHLKSKIRRALTSFMPIFYALFFIVGGAHLDMSVFPSIWLLSLVYFFSRGAGKILGAYTGGVVGKALPQVRNYVGFTLLPQVGAAIALALVVQQEIGRESYGQHGEMLAQTAINVLLVTTLLTELIGPVLVKFSLIKTGEGHS